LNKNKPIVPDTILILNFTIVFIVDKIDSSVQWLAWLLPSSDVDRRFDLRSGQTNNVLRRRLARGMNDYKQTD